jgi:putative pyruvate formate lyase activating enzyme
VDLSERLDFFSHHLEHCTLCPRRCGVNRLKGETGICGAGNRVKVASYCLHRGEEPPISGTAGSGTIFFSHCTLNCVYCQNYPISQFGYGNSIEVADLTGMMLELQSKGAHNINLVTATHFLPQVVEAIVEARRKGLSVPVVSNTSGYELPEVISMLDGLIQIYLVDMRYARRESSLLYSGAADYPEVNRAAVKEMLKCAGPLSYAGGLATGGVLIRHLLLPTLLEETREILAFIARELPRSVPVSLMTQYFPANRAFDYPAINRKITPDERRQAMKLLEEYGIEHGWIQDRRFPDRPVA